MFNTTIMSPDAVAEQIKGVDQSIINCAKSTKNGALTWDMYKESLNNMTLGAKAGQIILKGLAMAGNMAALWAISKAISLAASAWDHFNVTVQKAQEKIDSITSNLQNLNTEYKELLGKNNLTKAEQNRLEYLQSRIALEERLLKVEQTRLVREKLGNPDKISDWFDNDSYVKKVSKEFGESNTSSLQSILLGALGIPNIPGMLSNLHNSYSYFGGAEGVIRSGNFQYQKLTGLKQSYENAIQNRDSFESGSYDWNTWNEQADILIKSIDNYKDTVISESYADLLQKYNEYTLETEALQDILDNPEHLTDDEIKSVEHTQSLYSTNAAKMKELINDLAICIGDQSLWLGTDLELLDSKTDNLTAETLQNSFTDEEITILANLDFDKDASIETLRTLLEQEQALTNTFHLDSSFSLTEGQSDLIDNFQSKIKSLSGAMSAIQNDAFSHSDIVDLLQEFPELANQTDDLQTAITELSETLLEELLSSLGTDIPPKLPDFLKGIVKDINNTTVSMAKLISNIQSKGELMQSLQKEISGDGISSSTLQNIISQYPLLEDAVNAYCGGLLTEAELYQQLAQQYNQDLETFQNASRAKMYTNELFYSQCLNNNSELIDELAQAYELDFRNFKTVEAAKLAGEKKLLGNMAGLWSKYYNIVLGEDGLYRIKGTPFSETYDAQNSSEYIDLEEDTQKMQEYLNQLNKILQLDSIGVMNFTPGALSEKSSSSDSGDTEAYSKQLNWAEKLIARASTALDKLKDKISNTYISWSLRNHSLTQAMDKTKQSILTQQQAYETYMQKAASLDLPQEYITKIQNGSLDIETITDESLSDKIQEYETWYDKATACSDAIEELKTRLAELAKQRFDNINTYFTGLIETTEKSIARLQTQENNTFKALDASIYKSQYAETQTLIDYNTQRAKQLEEALDYAVNNRYIESGSEAWREMYNEILEVRNATEEYRNDLNELAKKEYDALLKPFETILTRLDQRKSVIEAMIGRLELQGHTASKGLYQRKLQDSEARLQSLTDQKAKLHQNMQDATAKGLEVGSDQWLEMQTAIDENISSTMELENEILQLKNSIRELDWEKFDRLHTTISHVTDESNFLMELIGQDHLYDENGRLSQEGNALLGLHARNYFTQQEQAKQYQAELDRITKELTSDPYNTTLEQRKYDLTSAYQAATKAAYEEYHAITELGQNGYQSQIDAIQKLIDAKKKQMDTDKSLYEHQKTIADKTKNIANIQKQLSALSGDESQENKAKIQKLKVDLEEAQKDLKETTYDKWYNDQSDMLDQLSGEYETLISQQNQDQQALFQEMISSANANAQSIQNTITDVAQKWGYHPSADIHSAWITGVDGITNIGANISNQIQRLYELNEKLYRASAALGDLGVTDYGLETTITDETTGKNFITRLYQGLLDRQPDEAGLNFWLERLNGGATVQDILEGFLHSPEYLAMNKSVDETILDFYEGLLGRTAETAGYQYWMAQYRDGMSLSEIGTHGFLDSREFLSDKMWLSLADNGSLLSLEHLLPSLNTVKSHTPNTADNSSPSFGDIHITIPIEHVNDYNDFVSQLQKDGKFERMMQEMTIGQVMGRGSLSKNSYRF